MDLKYKKDFPDEGFWNWKTVKFTNPKNEYYKNSKIVGVLLHDGNFLTNGVFFEKEEFEIIDENPLNISDEMRKEYEKSSNS